MNVSKIGHSLVTFSLDPGFVKLGWERLVERTLQFGFVKGLLLLMFWCRYHTPQRFSTTHRPKISLMNMTDSYSVVDVCDLLNL